MATGCEPETVSRMIEALKPTLLSACMAGAGGGGFLYLLTKEPHQREAVEKILSSLQVSNMRRGG